MNNNYINIIYDDDLIDFYCDRCNKIIDSNSPIYNCSKQHELNPNFGIQKLHRMIAIYNYEYNNNLYNNTCKVCRKKENINTNCGIHQSCPLYNFCYECKFYLSKYEENKEKLLIEEINFIINNNIILNDYNKYIINTYKKFLKNNEFIEYLKKNKIDIYNLLN